MLLWNTSKVLLVGRYDAKNYNFSAGEKKRLQVSNTTIDHLLTKLGNYGLVGIPDEILEMPAEEGKKALEQYRIKGMRNRRRMLDRVVRNFRTMNKAREAHKMSAEQPSDNVITCVEEIEEIDQALAHLKKDGIEKVNKYLDANKDEAADSKIDRLDRDITKDGKVSGEAALDGRETYEEWNVKEIKAELTMRGIEFDKADLREPLVKKLKESDALSHTVH